MGNPNSNGQRLKQIRMEKGLSLEEVHKKTKIHLNILKSIEEDNLVNLNPVYVKGFLKIYCKFLGVQEQDFISGYAQTKPEVSLNIEGEGTSTSFFKGFSSKISGLVPRLPVKFVFMAIGVFIVIWAGVNTVKFIQSRPRPAGKVESRSKPVVPLFKKDEKNAVPAKTPIVAVNDTIRLGIKAKEKCYIHLKSDGKVLFQGYLQKGRFESWKAKEKIEIVSLGNAGAVELEVNGKVISNLGKKGQALKNIVLTKEGLSIGR